MYQSINPSTEELFAEYPTVSREAALNKLVEISDAQKSWKKLSVSKRLEPVEKLLMLLEHAEDNLARIITNEMGKVFSDAKREVNRLKLYCTHALEMTEKILAEEAIPNPLSPASVIYEPLGVIYAITPWNVPIATPLRLSLPALLSGNGVILKPAPNVTGCTLALQSLIYEAGFPEDLFKVVCMDNQLAESLLNEPQIKKLAFVGSGPVGALLASKAASQIKPSLLELGGSDPFIVLADADLEQASQDAAAARCSNAGQVCCSAKRMIVVKEVYDEFLEKFLNQMRNKITGDPYAAESSYGPLARKDILDRLVEQVKDFKATSANILLDGGPVSGTGYFFRPMVFEETADFGFSTNQELFGPVASVFKAKDAKHACEIANLSNYGLGSAVYTKNTKTAKDAALALENGFVYINKPASLNPYLPFGGVKASGYGKDCGNDGYYEYVNKKIIVC